ncbi:MAG: hypothetical protein L0H83_07530 [Salinisphaera sp.]|nr:hypothetical protein [Salinisphaera sp.]
MSPLAIAGIVTSPVVAGAQSHFDYSHPLLEACTRRPLTAAEHAYFAPYQVLRQALPLTPAGWQAKDLSWTPPDQECAQKDTSDYILAVDINYLRSAGEGQQQSANTHSRDAATRVAQGKQFAAQRKALLTRQLAIQKANKQLVDEVRNARTELLMAQNKLTMAMISGDQSGLATLQAAYDAKKAALQPLKARFDKAQAPLDKLRQQQEALADRADLLAAQDRVAGMSGGHDLRQDFSARVYIEINVTEKNPFRMMITPLHRTSMNSTFVLCLGPQKMQVPGALLAWRCSNEDEYNNAANLEARRGAMIVAIFARSKADAPSMELRDDQYYDRHFQ